LLTADCLAFSDRTARINTLTTHTPPFCPLRFLNVPATHSPIHEGDHGYGKHHHHHPSGHHYYSETHDYASDKFNYDGSY
jgi:hypothetical protein